MPPGPVSVTRRRSGLSSSARIAATSAARPIKGVNGAGKVVEREASSEEVLMVVANSRSLARSDGGRMTVDGSLSPPRTSQIPFRVRESRHKLLDARLRGHDSTLSVYAKQFKNPLTLRIPPMIPDLGDH